MEYELLTSMLTSKLGHRKDYFFTFTGFGLQFPKISSHFCLKKLNHDFEINLHMADFYVLITTATWNHVPWKFNVEQLVTQQLNL